MHNLSQRRHSSAKVYLDTQSLQELNDYFADFCWDPDYKEPTPAEVCEEIQAPEISERHVWMCLQYLKILAGVFQWNTSKCKWSRFQR